MYMYKVRRLVSKSTYAKHGNAPKACSAAEPRHGHAAPISIDATSYM